MKRGNFVEIGINQELWQERFSPTAIAIALSTPLVQIALQQKLPEVTDERREPTDS